MKLCYNFKKKKEGNIFKISEGAQNRHSGTYLPICH